MRGIGKFLCRVGFGVLGVVAGCGVAGCGGGGEGPIHLTYSVFFPPSHIQAQLAVSWAREVEARSGGRVRISVYPGATLTKADQCWGGVVHGISDLGMSCLAYTPGRFPLLEGLDLPLAWPDGAVATRVASELAAKYGGGVMGARILYVHAHGPGVLATRRRVEGLEDLRGMKIRGTGLSAQIVEALGATAVGMSQPETYDALRKGVVDGTLCPMETLKGWRQGECVRYILEVPGIGYTTAMFVAMNRRRWEQLPEEVRGVITEVSAEWVPKHGEAWVRADEEGRRFAEAQGCIFSSLGEGEAGRWAERMRPLAQGYMDRCEGRGLAGGAFLGEIREAIGRGGEGGD